MVFRFFFCCFVFLFIFIVFWFLIFFKYGYDGNYEVFLVNSSVFGDDIVENKLSGFVFCVWNYNCLLFVLYVGKVIFF